MYYAIECLYGLEAVKQGFAEPSLFTFKRKKDLDNYLASDRKVSGFAWPSRARVSKREFDKLVKHFDITQVCNVDNYVAFPYERFSVKTWQPLDTLKQQVLA